MPRPPSRRAPTTALYAFSADPITYGHIDVVERVSRTFDRVIVGIGRNPAKKYLFSEDARVALARQTLGHLSNVTVLAFRGMVVDVALEQGACVIVKGVRNAADFDYEQVHHLVGVSQRVGIDTHVLFARPSLAHVSSSVAKAIQAEHGFIHDYVPPAVKAALEEVLSGQLIVGVTGEPGAGKSLLCEQLVAAGRREGLAVHDVDLDGIAHAVLSGEDTPLCAETRAALIDRFGRQVEGSGGVDRRRLAACAFGDPGAVRDLNRIMMPAVMVGLRKALYGLRGLVLLNSALLAEEGLLPLCNNRVILVGVHPDDRGARLAARGWDAAEVRARLAAQWRAEDKARAVEEAIARTRFGRLWHWDGSAEPALERASTLLGAILAETHATLERAPHAA
ncbi:pantetheine-phosphate adenylyltransferase [Anaeromyxobacter sp. K]|uniref:pantetheine-phosphate adenylyltransferase n=1 Tax=Anaeromyxobacter sp. (strain K) TaxID=447217 RepID=UPI00015F99CF|nr:pantetheine-phosphate adenylyltransferase [Anaeromyxobacter sp. K]ACG72323.1 pantetheine-phosphate adenylyltransferase [Anaeromyxobacter sp. K]